MTEIILSNEQISVARYSENGVIRINGGPGSGKTLVAVKRAIFLAKEYKYAEKNDKILFYQDKKLNYDKWLDIFFRYLINSILMITISNLLSINCSLEDDKDIENIYDYLNELSEKLESYYKMEEILQHIANKAKEILEEK